MEPTETVLIAARLANMEISYRHDGTYYVFRRLSPMGSWVWNRAIAEPASEAAWMDLLASILGEMK